jgi:hypothetical protein
MLAPRPVNEAGKRSDFLTPQWTDRPGPENINYLFIIWKGRKPALSTQKCRFQRVPVNVVSTPVSQMFFLAYFCRPFKINRDLEYVNHSKYS